MLDALDNDYVTPQLEKTTMDMPKKQQQKWRYLFVSVPHCQGEY